MDRFYYMRHGQVDANLNGFLCGGDWDDIPLNATGVLQVSLAEPLLRKLINIRTLCVSPTLRTVQTGDIVSQWVTANRIIIEDLREWRLGDWDRKPLNDVIPAGSSLMDYDPPRGETRKEFGDRIARAFAQCRQLQGDVLIVSHGAVWGALASHLGVENSMCDNGALLEVDFRPQPKATRLSLG